VPVSLVIVSLIEVTPPRIDIGPPVEFDDASNDKPSPLEFFNCLLNLYRIVHFTLRSLVRLSLFTPLRSASEVNGAYSILSHSI